MKRDMARDLCPMDQMHDAKTPTLILQGTDDQRCPVGQSEEIFATIMRSGDTPVEMVLYPGGDHHVAEQGKPSHRVDYVTRLTQWVERWTTERSDADTSTRESDADSTPVTRGSAPPPERAPVCASLQ
jgi:dipeptidyl aminopeptidase/acylaminoacyl peptidase